MPRVSNVDDGVVEQRRTLSCPSRSSFEEEDHNYDKQNNYDEESIIEEPEGTRENNMVDIDDVNDLDIVENMSFLPSILPTESRISPYPASGVNRFPVPDCYVRWTVSIEILFSERKRVL